MALKSGVPRKTRTRQPRAPASRAAQQRRRRIASAKPASSHQPGIVEAVLAVFAHEVRTPLTGILAMSDLLATSDLGERERRWVDTIKASAEHLAGLTTLFVDAARLHGARQNPDAAIRQDLFDLRALAHHVAGSLAGRAAAKGLQATVKIADTLPVFVIGDAVRLRAALENLIDNAVKFTSEGDIALRVTRLRAVKGKSRVSFAVSDNGIGVTLAEIKRLFRPFSQANITIASRFGGAGLGLSSVKQLARAMGGNIAVSSRRHGGATFTLTVTLASAAAPLRARDRSSGIPVEAACKMRVLSVEDNPFGRVVLNAILTELGHHAEFIGRGEEAADRVAQGGFDAVLMDMVLPGINGIETIGRVRALQPPHGRIPVIVISGRSEDEAPSRAVGADAFLLKPVSPRGLATALLAAKRRGATAP